MRVRVVATGALTMIQDVLLCFKHCVCAALFSECHAHNKVRRFQNGTVVTLIAGVYGDPSAGGERCVLARDGDRTPRSQAGEHPLR